MNKEKLVKEAYEGYMYDAEDEKKIIIDLNTFNEEVKEYLFKKHIDDDDYSVSDDDEFLDLSDELNKMLLDMFEKNGFDLYYEGGLYAEDGEFKNVNQDSAVAIKEN